MQAYQEILLEDANELLDDPQTLILDVRDAPSYRRGHIPKALLFDEDLFMQLRRRSAPRDRNVLVYCYRGHASREVADMLGDFGHTRVFSLVGGYESWEHTIHGKKGT